MQTGALREHVVSSILLRFAPASDARLEALRDVLILGVPNLTRKKAEELAATVPQLPTSLYERWAHMFAERLFATVPEEQIRELCLGTAESDASLALVFVMFMESERMEKVIADDLKALPTGTEPAVDPAALLGLWLKGRTGGTTQ